jgi:hypothetical protein
VFQTVKNLSKKATGYKKGKIGNRQSNVELDLKIMLHSLTKKWRYHNNKLVMQKKAAKSDTILNSNPTITKINAR